MPTSRSSWWVLVSTLGLLSVGCGAPPRAARGSSDPGGHSKAPPPPRAAARVVQVEGVLGRPETRWEPAAPAPVPGLQDVVEIAVAASSACALSRAGQVLCWGKLPGSRTAALHPQRVAGIQDAVEIALTADMGGIHACARRSNGRVVCWGHGADGALGDGTTIDRTAPVAVRGLQDAVEIAVSQSRSCARRANGTVVCWGGRAPPMGSPSTTPVEVPGLTGVVELALGWYEVCGRRADGRVVCWRAIPPPGAERLRVLTGLTGVVQLSAAPQGDALCGVLSSGRVRCWTDWVRPTEVAGLSDARAISIGATHRCAVRANGQVACWGHNRYNELHLTGPSPEPVTVPTTVQGL